MTPRPTAPASAKVAVLDLEADASAIRDLLQSAPSPLVLVGASPRSIPLALHATRAGIVVGVLPAGAGPADLERVVARGLPDRARSFQDIVRILEAAKRAKRPVAGNPANAK